MGAKQTYSKTIRNEYLNDTKVITGRSALDVEYKAEDQLRRWEVKEAKQREQDRIADLRRSADRMSREAVAPCGFESRLLYHRILAILSRFVHARPLGFILQIGNVWG